MKEKFKKVIEIITNEEFFMEIFFMPMRLFNLYLFSRLCYVLITSQMTVEYLRVFTLMCCGSFANDLLYESLGQNKRGKLKLKIRIKILEALIFILCLVSIMLAISWKLIYLDLIMTFFLVFSFLHTRNELIEILKKDESVVIMEEVN